MAKTVSEEEIQLRKRARRRLVGAITLVVAAIVFLPMLLDTKPEQRSQEIDIHIPPEDAVEELNAGGAHSAGVMDDSTLAADALTAEKQPGAPQGEQATLGSSVKSTPSIESVPVKPAERSPTDKVGPETGKPAVPNPAAGTFVVQLGAFSSPAKARQQLENLISSSSGEFIDDKGGTGATAYTETLKADTGSGKGEVTRVRVGPFATREQADAAHAKLKKLGFGGVVTDK